jgi:predicted nucleotide-binding protein
MSLPILTSVEDIQSITAYLRTKPTGSSISEAEAILKKAMDSRKVRAYVFWGMVQREGDRIKLSTRGWELARRTKTSEQIIREILDSIVPYHSALEWIYHQKLESVTNSDVAAYWHDHHAESLGSANENTIKDQAVCFFRLVEGGGLGKLTLGRNGAATRLDVNRTALGDHIEAGPSVPPLSESIEDELDQAQPASIAMQQSGVGTQTVNSSARASDEAQQTPSEKALRVFITHGKNLELVEQVETMLHVAEIESEVAVKEESTAIPVPEKVFSAMRRCTAGIIIVSAEQVQSDSAVAQINPNVLIEIGAAFVLYDRRVILLWEKGVPVPSNLQGLYRCEFSGDEISWAAGMKLLKAVKEFRR